MVIDAHSHWLPEEIIRNAHFFSRAWSQVEAQLAAMDASGIDKAVLTYPTSDAHLKMGSLTGVARVYNDNVAEVLRRYPGRFIGAALLPVGEKNGMLEELERATGEMGFRAVSLASSYNGIYLDDPLFEPVYRQAEQKGIPLFVHSQIIEPIGSERLQDPLLTPVIEYVFDLTVSIGRLLMSGTLQGHPGLCFVFANFGGVICHLGNRFDTTYEMLRGINFVKDLEGLPTHHLRRIYVDTGGDTGLYNFLAARELLGAGHICWGSDWPAKRDPAASIEAIKNLRIPEREKEDILGGTLQEIFK